MPERMTATRAWCGQSVERVEDAALLTGRGRFIDDLGVRPGTLHAAILRSPHPHARIASIRLDEARKGRGVAAVLAGADVTALSASLVVGVKAPVECWPIAVDRVRYVGEPVAVVVAADRYLAEDALELIEVEYQPLAAIVDHALRSIPRSRCCMTGLAPISRTNAASAMVIRSARSRRPRTAYRSRLP